MEAPKNEPQQVEEKPKKLTAKEERFVDEYCTDCNATQAAIRSGYSKKTAKEIGYENLTKPHIRAAVDARLRDLSLSAAEVTKRISDIATGSLNEYYSVREVEHIPRIEKPLQEVIETLKEEMDFEERYATRVTLTDKEKKSHEVAQDARLKKIIRYEMELERNPQAALFVDGPKTTKRIAELDMVKLVQDKEKG